MNNENQKPEELEVVPVSASGAIESAQVNSQIVTAKRFPRSLQEFKTRAIDMACLDEETAESCLYRRPVGMKNGVQTYAEGMSVRMAEIVGASYGNLRVQAQIIEQTPRFVRARGTAIDLESNFASSSEVVESTVKRDGTPYDERMRIVIAKAALSKAKRDATFSVVPRALAKPVETAVRSLLMGNSEALTKRRAKVVAWISKLGIDSKRVYAHLGIAGEEDIGVEQIEVLTGLRTALKDNEITIDEAFPDPSAPEAGTKKVTGITGTKREKSDPTVTKPDDKSTPPVVDDPAEKKKLLEQLEGLMLDLGWNEAGTMALAQPQLPKGATLKDLSVAQLNGLLAIAAKENKPA